MLKGKGVTLRPVEERDLDDLYQHVVNIENRGDYYPRSIQSMSEIRRNFNSTGFWEPEFGLLLITDNETSKIIGQIVFFKTVQYMSELEIGYIMYDTTSRARGGMTEACKLLTAYLFDTKQFNRIRLCIGTENRASQRVAEKSGYKHEGTMRGCFFSAGRIQDMELYGITRADVLGSPEGK